MEANVPLKNRQSFTSGQISDARFEFSLCSLSCTNKKKHVKWISIELIIVEGGERIITKFAPKENFHMVLKSRCLPKSEEEVWCQSTDERTFQFSYVKWEENIFPWN